MADQSTDVVRLTDRQRKAWPEAVARLREHYPVPESIHDWTVHYAEEARPGRGHFIDATLLDGEVFAQILMDVYGQPNVSIAVLDWMHADSNEECDCEPCERERAAEDNPPASSHVRDGLVCSCGWAAPLGKPTERAFDRHLIETRETP